MIEELDAPGEFIVQDDTLYYFANTTDAPVSPERVLVHTMRLKLLQNSAD